MTENNLNASSGSLLDNGSQKNAGCSKKEPKKLSKQIGELIVRCVETLDIRQENVGIVESSDLSHILTVLRTYLEQVLHAYTAANREANAAKDEVNRMKAENSAKIKIISDVESRWTSCKKQLEMIRAANSILEQRNEMFRKQLETYKKDVRSMTREHSKTKSVLDNIHSKYEHTALVYDEKIKQLTSENAALKAELKVLLEKKSNYERGDGQTPDLTKNLQEKSLKIEELERINAKLLVALDARARDLLSHNHKKTIELGEKASDEGCVCGDSESESRYQLSLSGTFMKKNEHLDQYLSRIEAELNEKTLENHDLAKSLTVSENKIWDLEAKHANLSHLHESLKQQYKALETKEAQSHQNLANDKHKFEAQNILLKNEIEVLRSRGNKLDSQIRSLLKSTFAAQDCGGGDDVLPKELESPIEYLQQRIISLSSNNNHLSKTSVELRGLISDLKERGGEIRRTSEELNTVCEKLKSDLVQSEKKVHSLENEKFGLSEMIKRLNKKIAGLKVTCQTELNRAKEIDSHRDVVEQLSNVTAEKNKLVDEVASLKEKEEDLDFALKELQGEVAAHQEVEEDLKAKVIDSENYILQVSEQLSTLQTRLRETDSAAKCFKKEKEQLNEAVQKLSQLSDKKETKINALQKENYELMSQVDSLTNELTSTHSIQTELKLYEEQNAFLKQELIEKEDAIRKYTKDIDCYKVLIDSQISEQEQLQADILLRDDQITQLEEEVSDLKQSQQRNEETIQDLQQSLDETVEEYSSYSRDQKKAIESFEQRIKLLASEKTSLETTNKDLFDKVVALGVSMQELQSSNAELVVQLNAAKENTKLEADFANLQSKYIALCADKDRLEACKSQLEDTCEQLFQQNELLTAQVHKLQHSAELLEKCNETSQSEIETLRKTYHRNRQFNEELQRKLQFVQSKLRATNTELASLGKLCEKDTSCTAAIDEAVGQQHTKMESAYQQVEHDLQLTTDNVVNLKKLFDQEVEKSNVFRRQVMELRELLNAKQLEVEDKNNLLAEMKTDFEEKVETIAKISSELLTFKHKNENLQEEISCLHEKMELISFLDNKLKEAQECVSLLSEENTACRKQVEELTSTKAALAKEVTQLASTNQELQLAVDKLSSILDSTKSSLESNVEERLQLELENEQLRSSMSSLQVALEELPNDPLASQVYAVTADESKPLHLCLLNSIVELRSSNDSLKEQNRHLNSELAACQQKNSELSKQVSNLSAEFKDLENDYNTLCSDLQALQEECKTLSGEKEAAQEGKLKTLASLNELKAQLNEIIRHHVAINRELNEKNGSLLAEFKALKAEKENRENKLIVQEKQLSHCEAKLNSVELEVSMMKELNIRKKRDVAILHAKLLESRNIIEQNAKRWEYERSKLTNRIQDAEARIRDCNKEVKNKLEHMRNKMNTSTLTPSTSLPHLDTLTRGETLRTSTNEDCFGGDALWGRR